MHWAAANDKTAQISVEIPAPIYVPAIQWNTEYAWFSTMNMHDLTEKYHFINTQQCMLQNKWLTMNICWHKKLKNLVHFKHVIVLSGGLEVWGPCPLVYNTANKVLNGHFWTQESYFVAFKVKSCMVIGTRTQSSSSQGCHPYPSTLSHFLANRAKQSLQLGCFAWMMHSRWHWMSKITKNVFGSFRYLVLPHSCHFTTV